MSQSKSPIAHRFRGYLPVVVDLETGGFNSATDALLEFAAVIVEMDDDGAWRENILQRRAICRREH
jgi:ribonuclease T